MYSLGKRGARSDVLIDSEQLRNAQVEVAHFSPRGGEVTYHGPGQWVMYPIINLRELMVGPRAYVEGLEDVMIATAAHFGVQAKVCLVPSPLLLA